ncbi:hypothetical protein [uncultured Clostridium sp.]|uniref:hypothetical protein n=1 Tax=uncultured Clostridium sp. TaxID=59620 RepID=UPI00262392F6|nr:hypothetical protein [uncultured Clostridium sp.]
MNDRDMIVVVSEEYQNNNTDEKVPGVGVVIDEKLRRLMDIIIESSPDYNTYNDLVKEALYQGLLKLIN